MNKLIVTVLILCCVQLSVQIGISLYTLINAKAVIGQELTKAIKKALQ